MSKVAEETQALLGIVNTADVLYAYAKATGKPVPPAIMYRAQNPGRGYRPAAWQVYAGTNVRTEDGKGYWQDYGLKTFAIFRNDDKAAQLEAAKSWTTEKYGVKEWKKLTKVRTLGDWLPAEVIDWFEKARKDARKEARSS